MPILRGEELLYKIVYWGPAWSGRSSNLHHLHTSARPEAGGQLVSPATGGGRLLLLDRFTPAEADSVVEGRRVSFQCCALVGPIRHSETVERLALQALDGIVFVADSQELRREANAGALEDLTDLLGKHGMSLDSTPNVFQYNKRDLPEIAPVEVLRADLNHHGAPEVEAVASRGEGVVSTFRALLPLLAPRAQPANPGPPR